jgi:hypothetical protein
MTIKSLLCAGTLALASLTLAHAKSYDFALAKTVQAGNVQLKPGQYTVKVQGGNAVFTDAQSDKRFTAPVKIENGAIKFGVTMVDTDKQGATDQLRSIELGGSTNTLEFGE